MSATSKRHQHSVDDILHREPDKDDGSDAREYHSGLLVLPAIGDHGQAQDDATGDLESGPGNVEIAEDSGPAKGEEYHNGSGGAFERGAQFSSAVLRLGHGKEDRRVVDWVDHHEMGDEGCDETLEHGLPLNPCAAHCPHQNK